MDKLFTLLELQRRAQEAPTRSILIHTAVNETHKIIPYTRAVFWTGHAGAIKLEKASGNSLIDEQSEQAAALKDQISRDIAAAPSEKPSIVTRQNEANIILATRGEGIVGGLLLLNDRDYNDAETRIMDELALTYANMLALLSLREQGTWSAWKGSTRRYKRYMLWAALGLALLPVRLSMTAPAEIVARKAELVTVPFDGIISDIAIDPGDLVKKGDTLATLDSQTLQAQADLAAQEVEIASATLSRLQRESLTDPAKRMALNELQEEVQSKKIALDYAKSRQEKSRITATRDGIAVFAQSHEWRGKPVATGDKIMMIADPSDYELLIRVPVESMIPVENNAKASFFLNPSPFDQREATIHSIGYQASPDSDGLLTYKILAAINPDETGIRIGWKGTAKIKGQWTILSYAILHRPLLALRNITGL